MSRKEKISVVANDTASAMMKKAAADEVEFVYRNKENLAAFHVNNDFLSLSLSFSFFHKYYCL